MFLKKLLTNTLIFALGNIFSKILIVLLLPILTGYFSTEEFGYIDIFTISLSLLIVILGFNTVEYLIKQVSQNIDDINIIRFNISLVIQITFISIIIISMLGIVFLVNNNIIGLFIVIGAIFQVVENILKQIHRSLDHNIVFISSEIIYSILFTVILLTALYLQMNYIFYFIAVIIALIFNILFLLVAKKLYKEIRYYKLSWTNIQSAIQFSFPLMLNSIMWYVVNLSNRYFIIYFISFSAAGVLSANMRLPLIITLIYSYLYKAVQILIYRNDKEDTKEALNILFGLLFILIAILSYYNEFVVNIFLDENFHIISNWLPLMYITAVLSSYSSILGINFMVSNETGKAFLTSAYTAVVSVVLNICLIPLLGILGAIVSMFLSFSFMTIIRLKTIKVKVVEISNYKFIMSNLIIIILTFLDYINLDSILFLFIALISIACIYIYDFKKIKGGLL